MRTVRATPDRAGARPYQVKRGSCPFFPNSEVPPAGTGPELDAEVSRCSVVPGGRDFHLP